jgi:hypothetical protein
MCLRCRQNFGRTRNAAEFFLKRSLSAGDRGIERRDSALPNVLGILVRTGTPEAILKRMNIEIDAVMREPKVKKRMLWAS